MDPRTTTSAPANPNDRIVSFDAYEVDDDSPPIGELNPRNVRSHIFLSYPPKR